MLAVANLTLAGAYVSMVGRRYQRSRHSNRFHQLWRAGRLVLDGLPAQAYDWDIQKQVEVGELGKDSPATLPGTIRRRSCSSHHDWHSFLISGLYGPGAVSFLPFLVAMRRSLATPSAICSRSPFRWRSSCAGRPERFLTAALIGGALYLIPVRPVLAGICLGLLPTSRNTGCCFDRADRNRALAHVISAAVTAVVLATTSWLAFGIDSWLAFFHWMPKFSQAFLTEGKAPWWKLQSIFAMVRYFGSSEPLGWAFQWVLTASWPW